MEGSDGRSMLVEGRSVVSRREALGFAWRQLAFSTKEAAHYLAERDRWRAEVRSRLKLEEEGTMSYDVWMVADLGGDEPVVLAHLDENHTSNCGPMFTKVLGGVSLPECDGWLGAEVMARLEVGLAAWDEAAMAAMNPPNCWGDSVSTRAFLEKILAACRAAPAARFRVCW